MLSNELAFCCSAIRRNSVVKTIPCRAGGSNASVRPQVARGTADRDASPGTSRSAARPHLKWRDVYHDLMPERDDVSAAMVGPRLRKARVIVKATTENHHSVSGARRLCRRADPSLAA